MLKFKLNRGDIGRIRKCIAHWKRLRDGKQKLDEAPEAWCCALCEKYYYQDYDTLQVSDTACNMCPLEQAFGACGCSTTNPYKRAYKGWRMRAWHIASAWAVAANRMIRALEKLLPKKKDA